MYRTDHVIPRLRMRSLGQTARTGTARILLGVVTLVAAAATTAEPGLAAAALAPIPPAPIRPAPAPPPPPAGGLSPLLANTTFGSVGVAGGAIPGGGPLTITFGPNPHVGLDAGCNQHGGRATTVGDQLLIGSLISTMMACPPPRSGADRWLARFTSVPLRWHRVGPVLTLSSPRQTVILTERAPAR